MVQITTSKNFKQVFTPIVMLFFISITTAQNVGIGTTTPNASAALDVSSTSKGLLMPRLTTTQRNAIASPAIGLQIFNLDDLCTDIYDGSNWIKSCGLKVVGTVTDTGSWTVRSNVGGGGRYGAVGFSIGSKGYIGTGKNNNGQHKNDFWEYNTNTNVWTQKANFGGVKRYEAVGFSVGSKGYIGTGRNDTTGMKNDFWEYDPVTNTWLQKANFGGMERENAVGFSINAKGYLGTGLGIGGFKNDFWEYDPVTNTWLQKANFGGMERVNAVGFSINGKGYLGTGDTYFNEFKDFWEYNPSTNTWVQKANFGGMERTNAVGFSIGSKGYMGSGSYNFYAFNDFWEYEPITNVWIEKPLLPAQARYEGVSFSIGGKGYIGTGTNGLQFNDFWEYNQNIIGNIYTSNPITSNGINILADGTWTFANGNIYNSNTSNVGVGTITPTNKLSVNGNSDISGSLGIGTATPANKLSVNGNSDITGTLGIGTTAPEAKLHVASSSTGLRIDVPATQTAFSIGGTGSVKVDAVGVVGGRLLINDNGNMGIGNTNPITTLDVNGGIRTKYSGTVVYDVVGGAIRTISVPIPTLPADWNTGNTIVIVTNADGVDGIVRQARLTSPANIDVKYIQDMNGLVRFNWVIFRM